MQLLNKVVDELLETGNPGTESLGLGPARTRLAAFFAQPSMQLLWAAIAFPENVPLACVQHSVPSETSHLP